MRWPWMALLVAVQAQAAPIAGTVTCKGKPVYAALVKAVADADSTAPLGEAYTDRAGRFALEPKAGAALLVASRTLYRDDGPRMQFRSAPQPLGKATLSFDRREVRGQEVVVLPADLTLCALATPPSEAASVEAAVQGLLRAEPAARAALAVQDKQLLSFDGGLVPLLALAAAFKRAEMAADVAAIANAGATAETAGAALGLAEMQATGLAWQAAAALYARQIPDALPKLRQALAVLAENATKPTRPGLRERQDGLRAVLHNLLGVLEELAGQREAALADRLAAAQWALALGNPVEAAEAYLGAAQLADAAGHVEQALKHARAGLDAAGHLPKPALLAKLWAAAAAHARDAELAAALAAGEAQLAAAKPRLDVATAANQFAALHAKQGRPADAVRLFSIAVGWLDPMPASPARAMQLWKALGSIGRGAAYQALDQHAQAVADLRRALGLQPAEFPPATKAVDHQLLGYSLSELNQFVQARQELLAASGLYAQSADPAMQRLALTMRDHAAMTWVDADPPDGPQALQMLDAALQEAKAKGFAAQEARLCETAAFACTAGTDGDAAALEKSLAYLRRAEPLYAGLADKEALARVKRHAAMAQRLLGAAQHTAGAADAEKSLRAALAAFLAAGQADEADSVADDLALLLYEQSRWAEAIPLWEAHDKYLQTPAAAEHSRETLASLPHPSAEARRNLQPDHQRAATLGLLASCYNSTGRPMDALAALQLQAGLWRTLGDRPQERSVLRELAVMAVGANHAASYWQAMQRLERESAGDDELAGLAVLRALPKLLAGDLLQARQTAEKLATDLAGPAQHADALPVEGRQGIVQALALVGALQGRLGEPARGLQTLERAAALGSDISRAALLAEIAELCKTVGRLQPALDTMRKALELHGETGMYLKPAYQLTMLLDMADIQRALGDMAAAEQTWRLAEKAARAVAALPRQTLEDRRIEGDFLAAAALRKWRDGNAGLAGTLANEALVRYPPAVRDDKVAMARVLAALAEAASGSDKAGQPARDKLKQAGQLAVETGAAEALLLVTDAAAADSQLPVGWAADLAAQGHARALQSGRLADLPALSAALGRMAIKTGDTAKAIALLRRAVEENEVLRSSLLSDAAKAGHMANADEALYGELEDLLASTGSATAALELADMRRGRALIDLLAAGRARQGGVAKAGSEELKRMAEAMAALAQSDQALDLHIGVGAAQRVDPRTGRLRAVAAAATGLNLDGESGRRKAAEILVQLTAARRQMAGSTAEAASLVTAPTVGAAEIVAMAKARKATLVEWSLTQRHLHTYVVQPDGKVLMRSSDLPGAAVDGLVARARAAVGAGVGSEPARAAEAMGTDPSPTAGADEALGQLHAALLAPVVQWLPRDGQAPLVLVPHKSMLLVPWAALPDREGKALAELHPLAVVPSLGVLRYTGQKAAAAAASGALVVGNPQMPNWKGQPLPQLPGAEAEARAVAAALGQAGTVLLVGAKATESAVRAAAVGKRYLHLASHGVARDDAPGDSFVALAAGDQDGLLTAAEVFDLQLRADLVVLSACQTGLGKISGDGVLGLGRAFLYAGTPRVLVSLWNVPDEPTALLMGAFYAALKAGTPPAEALQQAQLQTRSRFAQPSAWAAFVLVGEPR